MPQQVHTLKRELGQSTNLNVIKNSKAVLYSKQSSCRELELGTRNGTVIVGHTMEGFVHAKEVQFYLSTLRCVVD
jgi:hypothetical protein